MPNPFSPNPSNARHWENVSDKLKQLIKEIKELRDDIPSDVGLNVRIDNDGFSVSLDGFETEEDRNWNSSSQYC
jgi:hypothetical protein